MTISQYPQDESVTPTPPTVYTAATLPSSSTVDTIAILDDPNYPAPVELKWNGTRWIPTSGSMMIWQAAFGYPGSPGINLTAVGEFPIVKFPVVPANFIKSQDIIEIQFAFRKQVAGAGTTVVMRFGSDLVTHSNNLLIYNINVNAANDPQDIVATPSLLMASNTTATDYRTGTLGSLGALNSFIGLTGMTTNAPSVFSFHLDALGAGQNVNFYGGFIKLYPGR